MDYAGEIKSLQKKARCLQEENDILRVELEELKNYIYECDMLDKIYGKTILHGSYFGKMRNLSNFKDYWNQTVFWKYHQEIDNYKFITLDQIENIFNNPVNLFTNVKEFVTCNIMAYCEMAMPTYEGVLLHMVDPFGERNMFTSVKSSEDINKYVGKLLYLTCIENPNTNILQVMDVNMMPYTLYEKLK